jgi:hypothetical protein
MFPTAGEETSNLYIRPLNFKRIVLNCLVVFDWSFVFCFSQ